MSPLVALFGYEWTDWATSPAVDQGITLFSRLIGILFLSAALAAASLRDIYSWRKRLIQIAGGWLVVLAFLATKEKFFHLGQFFEYSLQMGSPFFFLTYLAKRKVSSRLEWAMRIAIALTFTCHGLYAIGYYPRPGNFTLMVMAGLGLSDQAAMTFLNWAGILDFVVSALVLLPWRKLAIVGLGYTIVWGFLTTMARIWSYLFITSLGTVLLQWTHESILRWPHFLIPVSLWLVWRDRQKKPAV